MYGVASVWLKAMHARSKRWQWPCVCSGADEGACAMICNGSEAVSWAGAGGCFAMQARGAHEHGRMCAKVF